MVALFSALPTGATQPSPPSDEIHELQLMAAPVADQPSAQVPSAFAGAFAEPAVEGPPTEATPNEAWIGTLPHAQLRLRRPIPVEVRQEDDSVGVWSPDLEEFGYGPHFSAAVEDFQQTVVEAYFALKDEADTLGPEMISLRDRLLAIIEWRP